MYQQHVIQYINMTEQLMYWDAEQSRAKNSTLKDSKFEIKLKGVLTTY